VKNHFINSKMSRVSRGFVRRIKPWLIFARAADSDPSVTAVQWFSSHVFAVNTCCLAENCKLERNSLLADLRHHGFKKESTRNYRELIKRLGVPRDCKLYSHPDLARETIETDIEKLHWQRPLPKESGGTIPEPAMHQPEPSQNEPLQPADDTMYDFPDDEGLFDFLYQWS
jgi:hypothetical protein